jgi:hypothetical protein
MKIDATFDPASSAVRIKQMAADLNSALAPRGSPDYVRIAEIVTELRLETSDIKSWVYSKLPKEAQDGA